MARSRTSDNDEKSPTGRRKRSAAKESTRRASSAAGVRTPEHALASTVQDQAASIASLARQQATTQLEAQKGRAAETFGTLAMALHEMSKKVSQQNEPGMAQYIDLAADQVEAVATALREQEFSQLLETAESVARRQPALFLAAAFAVGFAATRFLKNSALDQQGQ